MIPPWTFPTTVVMVDDDAGFLASSKDHLSASFCLETYVDAGQALERLTHFDFSGFEVTLSPSHHLEHADADYASVLLQFDTRRLIAMASNPDRFRVPSVAVIDFEMPELNGFELCRRLTGLPSRRILLTGKATEALAVKAFNEGLIDCYISKHSADYPVVLSATIQRLQKVYFEKMSAHLNLALAPRLRFLNDPGFLSQFEQLVRSRNIVEHYVLTVPPGLFLRSATGEAWYLLAYDNELVTSHCEIIQDVPQAAELGGFLVGRSAIAWFPTPTGVFDLKFLSNWCNYVWPASQWGEQEIWYCSIVPAQLYAAEAQLRSNSYANFQRFSPSD